MNAHDKELVRNYLTSNQPFPYQGTKRYSVLIAALRECRLFAQRNQESGKFDEDNKFGSIENWLPCIGYFSILDQIGSSLKRLGTATPNGNYNKIKFSIEEFGFDLIDNSNQKLDALIALRNAFTHDFNLLNVPTNNNLQQKVKITVYSEVNANVVKISQRQWDGNIIAKDFNDTSDSTFINLFGVAEMVENIYSRICTKHEADEIDCIDSIPELINKYTFVTSANPIKNS